MDSKMVNISSLPFSPAVVVSFLIFQVTPLMEADKDDQLYFAGIIPVVFMCITYTLSYVNPGLPPQRFKFLGAFPSFKCSSNAKIYLETAVVVVISYVSLLVVNWSYIWLAAFPAIAIVFIIGLCNELNRQSALQQGQDGHGGGDDEGAKETVKAERQEAAALVPYWVLCAMGQLKISHNFAVSQFLLFLSFILGALMLMTARLALAGVAPGVAAASELLRKASLVVTLMAVHAVAAELLGEDVLLFVLPELAPALLWISVHLDRSSSSVVTVDRIRSHRNVLTLLSAVAVVVLARLAVSTMDELVLSWCAKALVSCGVSRLLVYYVVFTLCQWPGQDGRVTPFLEEAVKLLGFWANVLLTTAAALLVVTFLAAVRLGLYVRMVDAPAEFFNEFVTSPSAHNLQER
ncbi:hypothetical protein ACP70R_037424 [Stipagrostis hirtigluma subsp. patula]